MKVDFTNISLKIGNETIERIGNDCKTKSFKFVGIHLDEFITWENHIKHVHGKLSSGNFAIGRAKNFLPKKIRLNLYNSLFRSHLEFGILSWGSAVPSRLKRIEKLQKKVYT